MKSWLTILLFCWLGGMTYAQSNFQEAIEMGDFAFKKEQYQKAIDYYFAAEAFDPRQSKVVKEKINFVFRKIEELRRSEIELRKEAIVLLEEAVNSKNRAAENLKKANNLINAFDFYDDKFALGVNFDYQEFKNYYYFIDKEGKEVKKLRRWNSAEQFDYMTGLSRVQIKDYKVSYQLLLDTIGQIYTINYSPKTQGSFLEALEFKNESDISLFGDSVCNEKVRIILSSSLKLNEMGKFLSPTVEILDLSANYIEAIPEDISICKNLRSLFLNSNKIEFIPASINSLQFLQELWLLDNNISKLPDEIFDLPNLKRLVLTDNRIETISPKIQGLKSIEGLSLNDNKIKELPDEFYDLISLKELDLSENKIETISSRIKGLINIEHMYLGDNVLEDIPEELFELENLMYLNFSVNYLNSISPNVKKAKKLLVFDISNNELEALPEEIGNLNSLRSLNVSGNEIGEIPETITFLSEMIELDLSENNISNFSFSGNGLNNLIDLDLSGNSIQIQGLNLFLSGLDNLEYLNLANMGLYELPYEIINLKNLKQVNFENKLESKGPENEFTEESKLKIKELLHSVNVFF